MSVCVDVTDKAKRASVCDRCRSLLDEVGEEERGVADDACGSGLLVLTKLQGQPVIRVALRMQARLGTGHTQINTHVNIV